LKNFAITGVAGYVAPRHLKAIKETGHRLVAAADPHDSVGILDSFFPDTSFFTEYERFDRHLEKLRRESKENRIDYLTICSPNHLHDAHIRLALRVDANAICEKPLVINPWNLDALQMLEEETGKKVYTILQLRLHPSLIELKKRLINQKQKTAVLLTYITSRGLWYNYSWKGNEEKSGGIAANIGIHFFDILIWLFGNIQKNEVHLYGKKKAGGFLELDNAYVQWFLSIDKEDLPVDEIKKGTTTYRSISINGEEINFSSGFSDLHTRVYKEILEGNGSGVNEARTSIELVHKIRHSKISDSKLDKEYIHFMTQKNLQK
jgi:UDP-N-acetyl-2-amino-2-deoxyglucuronate dehydrogenase